MIDNSMRGGLDLPADSRPGTVYQLGTHRLLCGDTRDPVLLAELLQGVRLVMVDADPPYGMGKHRQGVLNDELTGDRLDVFQMAWWSAWRPHMADNASAYIWGNAPDLWRWWLAPDPVGLDASEPLTLCNEVVWNKGSAQGMRTKAARRYPRGSERCLFFMLGRHHFGNRATRYWEGWEPLRLALRAELERAGWRARDLNRITGTQMSSHWTGRSQFAPIPEMHWCKLQQAAAAAGLDAFQEGYEAFMARAFGGGVSEVRERGNAAHRVQAAAARAGRPYFDNTHEPMIDVWTFGRVVGKKRHGHPTPKPVAMIERAIKSSSRPGDAVGSPFAGSGTDVIAAARTGRACYAAELSPAWCDVIRRRWTTWALEAGVAPGAGALT